MERNKNTPAARTVRQQHYENEAARMRGLAAGAKSTEARAEFLWIASLYESLADHVRAFLNDQPQEST
jgi:hypothetical protein